MTRRLDWKSNTDRVRCVPPSRNARGFTLIELMIALLVLSILALMAYRGLGVVLDSRDHIAREAEKWRNVAAFFSRFERDVNLAALHLNVLEK